MRMETLVGGLRGVGVSTPMDQLGSCMGTHCRGISME